MFLYIHINKHNNKKYVGITKNPDLRWEQNGKNYQGSYFWNKGISQFGWDNFEHIILNDDLSENLARQVEARLIKELDLINPDKGYNESSGDIIKPNQEADELTHFIILNKIPNNKTNYMDFLTTDYSYVSHNYTLDYLYDLWKKGKINTDLDCQRNYVWTEERQQGMWDTLLRGQIIPEIHAIRNGMYYDIIDGKQRLTTMMRILGNKIPIKNMNYTSKAVCNFLEALDSNNLYFKDLPNILQEKINNTSVRICEYNNITDKGIMELFRKLNASMPLSEFGKGIANNIFIRTKFTDKLTHLDYVDSFFTQSQKNNDKDELNLVRFLILMKKGICDLQPRRLQDYYGDFSVSELNKYKEITYNLLINIPKSTGVAWSHYSGNANLFSTPLFLLQNKKITLEEFNLLPALVINSKINRRGRDLSKNAIEEDINMLYDLLKKENR